MSGGGRACGEAGWTARLVPLTVDGLIYASSMVMLDSARRKAPVPALARWLLGAGIAATLAANVAHGMGAWRQRRGGGRVASGCPGRLVRAPDNGHLRFPGSGRDDDRDAARCGPAAGAGGGVAGAGGGSRGVSGWRAGSQGGSPRLEGPAAHN